MNWRTKLTQSGYTEADFGQTFNGNVKNYDKYSGVLNELKKALKAAPENEIPQIQQEIETVKDFIDKLDNKLYSNIKRMMKNPDAVKANKERMAGFAAKNRKTPAEPVTAEKVEGNQDDKEKTVAAAGATTTQTAPASHTQQSTTTQQQPKAQTNTTTKQAAAQTTTTAKKKSNTGLVVGVCVGILCAVLGIGYAIKQRSK